MFEILEKASLNATVTRISVHAPLIANKAEPGQFIILRAKADSERIPLTIADFDRAAGSITLIFQVMGARATTAQLNLDRFWRNVRTQTLHDPIDYKYQEVGEWVLTGKVPEPSFYS